MNHNYEIRIKTYEYKTVTMHCNDKKQAHAICKAWEGKCAKIMLISHKRGIPCLIKA